MLRSPFCTRKHLAFLAFLLILIGCSEAVETPSSTEGTSSEIVSAEAEENHPEESQAENVTHELVIGRWCDRPLPSMPSSNNIITIRIDENGGIELLRHFLNSGSETMKKTLTEIDSNVYRDDNANERYRIVSSTGNLQLLDDDGLIRSATRLENFPVEGECQ